LRTSLQRVFQMCISTTAAHTVLTAGTAAPTVTASALGRHTPRGEIDRRGTIETSDLGRAAFH
jgi:hypothetical protein